MRFLSAALVFSLLFAIGCAHRSEKATNVEDEPGHSWRPWNSLFGYLSDEESARLEAKQPNDANIAPAPQQIEAEAKARPPGTNPKLLAAERLYGNAEKDFNEGAYLNASRLLLSFIDSYPGYPGFESAHYKYGYCMYALGRPAEALPPLRVLIQSTQDASLANDARILLAESLLGTGANDEALALTYEVMPNTDAEKNAGLERAAKAVGTPRGPTPPNLDQKIRLYTIRGRIFAALRNEAEATVALKKAFLLLDSSPKTQISQALKTKLLANWAWRQIEVTGLICSQKHPAPSSLSEAEFLDYAGAYYGCAAKARPLFCKVHEARDEQIESQALISYRSLVEAPLALKDHLPSPARLVRKKSQRPFYEREMKTLIEKTVQERSKEFRNLDACNALGLF